MLTIVHCRVKRNHSFFLFIPSLILHAFAKLNTTDMVNIIFPRLNLATDGSLAEHNPDIFLI